MFAILRIYVLFTDCRLSGLVAMAGRLAGSESMASPLSLLRRPTLIPTLASTLVILPTPAVAVNAAPTGILVTVPIVRHEHSMTGSQWGVPRYQLPMCNRGMKTEEGFEILRMHTIRFSESCKFWTLYVRTLAWFKMLLYFKAHQNPSNP